MTDEQIRALSFYERSEAFDDKERATVLFADRVTRGAAAIRDAELAELRRHYGEDEIVELALVIALANFTNRVNDALRIEPDIG